MLYMVTFTINIPQMLAYIPYMDPMGNNTVFNYIVPLFMGMSTPPSSVSISRLPWKIKKHPRSQYMAD